MPAYRCIAFLTDYGLQDGFVAACKGVLLDLAPDVPVIDITHQVPPQDVRRAAAVLAQCVPDLPPSVVLAVVDPGVGTTRRGVAVAAGPHVLVGPDNGLLSWTWGELGGPGAAVSLEAAAYRRPATSATFHGRDVFAPAAAWLARGVALSELGPPVAPADLVRLPAPASWVAEGAVAAEVLSVDWFGNVQLACSAAQLAEVGLGLGDRVVVAVAGREVPVRLGRTFADVDQGDLVLLEDSAGWMALAVNGGSAAVELALVGSETVVLRPLR